MKNITTQKVYYADTDAYGVVWHGTYLRWLEIGRTEFCSALNFNLAEQQKQDIIFPITSMNLRYKSSAKLDDDIEIETICTKITPLRVEFKQTIRNRETGVVNLIAEVEAVAVNSEGKLYRRMPDKVLRLFEEALNAEIK